MSDQDRTYKRGQNFRNGGWMLLQRDGRVEELFLEVRSDDLNYQDMEAIMRCLKGQVNAAFIGVLKGRDEQAALAATEPEKLEEVRDEPTYH